MASTYTPIATTTLGSAASSYTFSSIPSTFTDLVLILNGYASTGDNLVMRFNGDTGTNYSYTGVWGNGTSALSGRQSNGSSMILDYNSDFNSAAITPNRTQIMNYSNTTTYKTCLMRQDNTSRSAEAGVGLWRSTAAINQIQILFTGATTMSAGFTLTLYGILAA
jgi:hypothetical protein